MENKRRRGTSTFALGRLVCVVGGACGLLHLLHGQTDASSALEQLLLASTLGLFLLSQILDLSLRRNGSEVNAVRLLLQRTFIAATMLLRRLRASSLSLSFKASLLACNKSAVCSRKRRFASSKPLRRSRSESWPARNLALSARLLCEQRQHEGDCTRYQPHCARRPC
jgi:hypothetical protein